MTPKQALREAKKKAGSDGKLAKLLGVTKQAVNQWEIVPIHHVLKIEELFGILRSVSRPDVYPPPASRHK